MCLFIPHLDIDRRPRRPVWLPTETHVPEPLMTTESFMELLLPDPSFSSRGLFPEDWDSFL